MEISKVEIKNYRSCKHTVFQPNKNLSILIGPNGSGKTNILTAIRLLSQLHSFRRMRRYAEHFDDSHSPCEIKVSFNIDGKTVDYTANIYLVTNERNEDEIINAKEHFYMFSITGSKRRIQFPIGGLTERSYYKNSNGVIASRVPSYNDMYHFEEGLKKVEIMALRKIAKYISKLSYYSASQFTNPSNCPISFEVERDEDVRRGISITGHKRFLYDMYKQHLRKSDEYAEFIEIVGSNGIGLINNIEFKEVQTSSSRYSVLVGGKVTKREKRNLLVIPSFHIGQNNLSPSQLSEGTFKTLALIYYLVTDNSSLLMIEEPEVCVHQGLLSSIVELVKSYSTSKQILMSTHSDSVLDSLKIANIFQVKNGEKGTEIINIEKSLLSIELIALRDYLENEGNLGEFWKHGDLENG